MFPSPSPQKSKYGHKLGSNLLTVISDSLTILKRFDESMGAIILYRFPSYQQRNVCRPCMEQRLNQLGGGPAPRSLTTTWDMLPAGYLQRDTLIKTPRQL